MDGLCVCISVLLVCQIAGASYAGHRYNARETQYGEYQGGCEYDEDCITPFAFCKSNRVCECRRSYQYDERSDACYSTQLGLRCNADSDCGLLNNAQCKEGLCQCRSGHVMRDGADDCLPARQLSATCEEDAQCKGVDEFSHCNVTTKLCDCNPGYHSAVGRGQCVPSIRLKEQCTSHEQCAIVADQRDKVECRRDSDNRNKCLCRDGFSANSQNICARGGDGGAATIPAFTFTAVLLTAAVTTF